MTRLSVNLNKVALLRNARAIGIPSVVGAAEICIAAGAHGITVHPRPDGRHIRRGDVLDLAAALRAHPHVEYNVEGNPTSEFVQLVSHVRPAQVTLVPDAPDALTSDHGWRVAQNTRWLTTVVREFTSLGIRVSLFMDYDSDEWTAVRDLGAERVELYTQPYAAAAGDARLTMLDAFRRAAEQAQRAELGVNAGHDLNLSNLGDFCRIPRILEVSIGHALIADALQLGLAAAVKAYLTVLAGSAELAAAT